LTNLKVLKVLYDIGANANIIKSSRLRKLDIPTIKTYEENQKSPAVANETIINTNEYINLKININNSCTIKEIFVVHFFYIFN